MKRTLVATSALALALLTAGGAIAATNKHVLGAQACVGQNVTNAYGAMNTTGGWQTWYCPMVLDNLQSGVSLTGGVVIWDRNRSADVFCRIWAKDSNGNIATNYPLGVAYTGANAKLLQTGVGLSFSELALACDIPAFDAGGPGGGVSGLAWTFTNGI